MFQTNGCGLFLMVLLFLVAMFPLIMQFLWFRRMRFGSIISTGPLSEYPFSQETDVHNVNSVGESDQSPSEDPFVELLLILTGRTLLYSVKTNNCLNARYPGAHWICGYDPNPYLEAELRKRFGLDICIRTWSGYGQDEWSRTVRIRVPPEDVGSLCPRWIDLCIHQMHIALRSGYTEGAVRAIRADELEMRIARA